MSDNADEDTLTPADGLQCWTATIDGILYACWYRQREDGYLEIVSPARNVVLPVEAVALLPEKLARSVLARVTHRTQEEHVPPP